MTSIEQQIALLRDAMRERARVAGNNADGYCHVEAAYENAAADAERLLFALRDVEQAGGVI